MTAFSSVIELKKVIKNCLTVSTSVRKIKITKHSKYISENMSKNIKKVIPASEPWAFTPKIVAAEEERPL